MKSLHKILYISAGLWLLMFGSAKAQTADTDEDNYTSVTTYGVTTNTNSGILGGFAFRQARLLPGTFLGKRQYRYISVELVNVKHPKEVQQQTAISGSRYIYGKQNYLFVLRPQYGREITLFRRNADEGVAINAILAAGPSLGIIKPYYVQVSYGNTTRNIPYRPALASSPTENIIGSGGFFQGFGQSQLTVGVNVKAAVSFELSAFRNNTTGVEIGVLAEAFPKEIVIIPNTTNRSFFTSGYATLFFGTKK